MLRIKLRDSKPNGTVTRREVLRMMSVGALAPGILPGHVEVPTRSHPSRFGHAKAVVFVTLYGGPPQTETFDMKPEGPEEARGPFRPVSSRVEGISICERLPELAKLSHLYTLVRSFSHEDTAHASGLYAHLTGWPHPRINMNSPATPFDHPHYGSVVGYLRQPREVVPPCVIVGGRILPQFRGIGQTGGYLGEPHTPYVVPQGETYINHYGTKLFSGVSPELNLPDEIGEIRLSRRHRLLEQLDARDRAIHDYGQTTDFSTLQQSAITMVGASRLKQALDINQESYATRDLYGRYWLGQNLLLSRRLLEAGVPVIQVSDIPERGEQHWDLHYPNIFDQLKDKLLPRLDQSLAAFLTDLHENGLLDQTLVIAGGEFGRTPWMDKIDGGRQHWPRCYSMLLAGGGIQPGRVYGGSDKMAAWPTHDMVKPWDLGATIYHLLGINPFSEVFDERQQRIRRISAGSVIEGLL